MLFKLDVIIIFFLNFLYVFRSIAVIFRLENIMYLLTALLVGINMIYIFGTLKKQKINIADFYVLLGVTIMIYSGIINPPMVGIIGFTVLFLNLLFWNSFIKIINKENLEILFKKYVKLNVYLACVMSIIGIYQYFVDPSIMGLAINDIYGSAEMMESGRVVRRVTSLMGSPQNYSLYIAVITSLVAYLTVPTKNKIIVYTILISGGGVSGSRAFVVFLLLVLLVNLFINSTVNVKSFSKMVKRNILFALSSGIIILFFNVELSNKTVSRMFSFLSDWPALEIYKYHLGTINIPAFLLGKGLGVNERIVVNFLGSRYYDSVGVYLHSYESYFLSIFMQLGIFGLILFSFAYIKSMIKAYKRLDGLYFSILVAILINLMFTPSFNGLAMSFIIWPLILYPLYSKKSQE